MTRDQAGLLGSETELLTLRKQAVHDSGYGNAPAEVSPQLGALECGIWRFQHDHLEHDSDRVALPRVASMPSKYDNSLGLSSYAGDVPRCSTPTHLESALTLRRHAALTIKTEDCTLGIA